MHTLRRVGFYLGGLSIGLIIFAFFIKGRGVSCEFDYLPNARVLKNIRMKKRVFAPQIRKLLDTKVIDTAQISTILKNGDVDFSRSNIKLDSCKLYVIQGNLKEKDIELHIQNCTTFALIKEIKMK